MVVVSWLVYMFITSMPLYGGSILNSMLVLETDVTEGDLSIATTIYTAMTGILAPFVGVLIKKRGAKITFLIGLCLSFAAALGNIFLPASRWQLILCHSFLVAMGIGVGGSLSTQSLVIKWFDKNQATALSLALTSGAVGGFIAPMIMNAITANNGRKGGWVFIAIGAAVMFVLALVTIKNTPEEMGEIVDGHAYARRAANATAKTNTKREKKSVHNNLSLNLKEALREKEFYISALMAIFRLALYYSFTGYVVVYAVQTGIPREEAALLISFVSISSLVGRLACGALGNMGLSPKVMSFVSGICMSACGIFLFMGGGGSMALFIIGSLCCGIGFGISMVSGSMYITYYFGPEYYPVIYGAVLPVSTIMAAVGPAAAGAVATSVGSYAGPFLVMGLANVVVSLICLLSKMPRKRRLTA